jgi:hypothetical protein
MISLRVDFFIGVIPGGERWSKTTSNLVTILFQPKGEFLNKDIQSCRSNSSRFMNAFDRCFFSGARVSCGGLLIQAPSARGLRAPRIQWMFYREVTPSDRVNMEAAAKSFR